MKSNWNYPTTMWVGEDRIKDLSVACKNLHCIRHETNIEIKNMMEMIKNKIKIEKKILPQKDYFI